VKGKDPKGTLDHPTCDCMLDPDLLPPTERFLRGPLAESCEDRPQDLLKDIKKVLYNLYMLEILPGFSIKNKDWAEDVGKKLEDLTSIHIVHWPHWETRQTSHGWIKTEAQKIAGKLKDQSVSILAKSVGTLVAMEVLKMKPNQVDKIILCGIPTKDFKEGDQKRFEVLTNFPADKVLVIQNTNDNHGPIVEVETLISGINPHIRIIPKPRDDHEYPYLEDFVAFFK